MYYTVFNQGTPYVHQIVHKKPKEEYVEGWFSFGEGIIVKRKPTLQEAETLFSLIDPTTLQGQCEGITVKLT